MAKRKPLTDVAGEVPERSREDGARLAVASLAEEARRKEARRKEAVDYARRLMESEGLNIPAFALSQGERFVAGEISQADFLASL